jgi:hypothetical protein
VADVISAWTGRHADALRRALRMTNEAFAEHLGVAIRTVAYWRARPGVTPTPVMQQALDTALARAPERAQVLFWELLEARDRGWPTRGAGSSAETQVAARLTEWLTATTISDEAISSLDGAVVALAEGHPRRAPVQLLADAGDLQASIQRLLRGGRLRHRQERELLRINGDVLAHISLLLSDLNYNEAAGEYGNAALLYLREASATEAPAWYVLAKIARWRHQFQQAADLARQGLQRSSASPMRVQLACYEANAAALAGDAARARAAMRHAEHTAAALPGVHASASPWSFPEERMTIFRLSVALHAGSPDDALREAWSASMNSSPTGQQVPAAWAQIRTAGAIACVLKDEPDGAVELVRPVLALPPDLRIATVTGWLADLDRHLGADRYTTVREAEDLRHQIHDFTATALPRRLAKEDPP